MGLKKIFLLSIFTYNINFFIFNLNSFTNSQSIDNQDVDIAQKHKSIKEMTKKAVAYFSSHTVDESAYEFLRNTRWHKGEIFPFIFDEHGICYVHGPEYNLIWKNISKLKILNNISLIENMLDAGTKGNYISYPWNNYYKTSYVQTVKKNGHQYVIGAGFFPENAKYKAQQIVNSAIQLFNFKGKDITFALVNNPRGILTYGDIFSFVYDFEGLCIAYGGNFSYIGQNRLEEADSQGKYFVKEFIKVARSPKHEGWVDYISDGVTKKSFVKRVVDPKTKKEFLIGAGYYPNQTFDKAKDLAQKAATFIKQVGTEKAFENFNNPTGPFRVGGLAVFVIGLNGYCYAKGNNLDFVNHNIITYKDDDGRPIIKSLIDSFNKIERGSKTIHYKKYGANIISYVEKIDVPEGKFLVGVDYYSASKKFAVESLVDDAAVQLAEATSISKVFHELNSKNKRYFIGDLKLFVYDTKGICLADGTERYNLWQNYTKSNNQGNRDLMRMIQEKAFAGGGWITYSINNAKRRSYIKLVKTNGHLGKKNFIVGSGYFL